MKIIVCGSRDFADFDFLKRKMDALTANLDEVTLISGHAEGADLLGERWAEGRWQKVMTRLIFRPDYDRYGKAAPLKRNEEMAAAAGRGGACVAFHAGASPGTGHMIGCARRAGLRVKVFKIGGDDVRVQRRGRNKRPE